MFLKKGEIVYLSETGHKGFFYPSAESETLLEDVDAQWLGWIGDSEKIAVLIPNSSIFGVGRAEAKTAVWVKK